MTDENIKDTDRDVAAQEAAGQTSEDDVEGHSVRDYNRDVNKDYNRDVNKDYNRDVNKD